MIKGWSFTAGPEFPTSTLSLAIVTPETQPPPSPAFACTHEQAIGVILVINATQGMTASVKEMLRQVRSQHLFNARSVFVVATHADRIAAAELPDVDLLLRANLDATLPGWDPGHLVYVNLSSAFKATLCGFPPSRRHVAMVSALTRFLAQGYRFKVRRSGDVAVSGVSVCGARTLTVIDAHALAPPTVPPPPS